MLHRTFISTRRRHSRSQQLVLAAGGRVIAKENGRDERTILVEFESFDAAVAAYESYAYQLALAALDGGADRDIRLFEGVD